MLPMRFYDSKYKSNMRKQYKKQNRESNEVYSRRKVAKRHDKFGKACLKKLKHKEVPKKDGTKCP